MIGRMKGVLGMANFRRTATGDAIYACLMQASVPLTAADVYESVRAQYPKLALTTVYRTLDRLCTRRLAVREPEADGAARYRKATQAHHHYLVCLKCNKRLTLNECPLHEVTENLAKDTGFDITEHQLLLYGYCPNCREKEH